MNDILTEIKINLQEINGRIDEVKNKVALNLLGPTFSEFQCRGSSLKGIWDTQEELRNQKAHAPNIKKKKRIKGI